MGAMRFASQLCPPFENGRPSAHPLFYLSCTQGADLAHVICEPNAGAVIKTYSPDLIVHGILDPAKSLDDIKKDMKSIIERLVSARSSNVPLKALI